MSNIITKFSLFESKKHDILDDVCNLIMNKSYDKVKPLLSELDEEYNSYVLVVALLSEANKDFIDYLSNEFNIDIEDNKIKQLLKNKKVVEDSYKIALDNYKNMSVEEPYIDFVGDTAIEYSFYVQKEKGKNLNDLSEDEIFEETRIMIGMSANFEVEPEELFNTWLYVDDFDQYHDPKSNTPNGMIDLSNKLLGIKKVAKKPTEKLIGAALLSKKFGINDDNAEQLQKLIDKVLDMDNLEDRMDYVDSLDLWDISEDDDDKEAKISEYLRDITSR